MLLFPFVGKIIALLTAVGLSLGELNSGTVEIRELAILLMPLAVSMVAGWLGSKLKAVKNVVVRVAIIAIGVGAIVASRGYLDASSAAFTCGAVTERISKSRSHLTYLSPRSSR